MPACPRCNHALDLRAHGTHRDAHGAFVPASALRRETSHRAAAMLAATIANAAGTDLRCPGCLTPMKEARIPVPGTDALAVDGCPACGGWWFDAGEQDRLRQAVLARKPAKTRQVGGYGGVARTVDLTWASAETLYAMLEILDLFT